MGLEHISISRDKRVKIVLPMGHDSVIISRNDFLNILLENFELLSSSYCFGSIETELPVDTVLSLYLLHPRGSIAFQDEKTKLSLFRKTIGVAETTHRGTFIPFSEGLEIKSDEKYNHDIFIYFDLCKKS